MGEVINGTDNLRIEIGDRLNIGEGLLKEFSASSTGNKEVLTALWHDYRTLVDSLNVNKSQTYPIWALLPMVAKWRKTIDALIIAPDEPSNILKFPTQTDRETGA